MKKAIVLLILCLASWGLAADPEHGAVADKQPHPQLSQDGSWAGVMVILVLGMFALAAGVGVVVRLNTLEEPPPDAHDDHGHTADHGHGHGH